MSPYMYISTLHNTRTNAVCTTQLVRHTHTPVGTGPYHAAQLGTSSLCMSANVPDAQRSVVPCVSTGQRLTAVANGRSDGRCGNAYWQCNAQLPQLAALCAYK
eukprot:16724-Heterococcus_DN1.PRE.1